MRRLSERIDREAAAVYAEAGVEFEQRWFGVLNQLTLNGSMTVGALAEALGVTHAAVSQARVALEARGLVRSATEAKDARRRAVSMTQKGRALFDRLTPFF
ncbi:MAG: MarR family transcriptional regulator, partial [Parvularculaceae bacterium]|nr:MarR family transcriptional regulator [Parvularculaceae bacterium]